MFCHQIHNLMSRCSYPDHKLVACVRTAAKTMTIVISDTLNFNDQHKINMALD